MNSNYSCKDIEMRDFQAEIEDYAKPSKHGTNVFKRFIAEHCGKTMRKCRIVNAGMTYSKGHTNVGPN